MWVDTHCHLPWSGVDADEALAEARAAGVSRLVSVGTDAAQSRAAIELAAANEGVWATVGLHPHDAVEGVAPLLELVGHPSVVAVGECGLDYHYDHSPRAVQREAFAQQVALANDRDLALVIHTREAWDDTFAVLADVGVPARTVFHCFTGGPREAERALGMGALLSFSGIVTFRTATEVQEAARACPADRLLVETDSPYLAPVPHRGKQNRPAWVVEVGAFLARLRGEDVADVAAVTSGNAERAFRLPQVAATVNTP